MKSCKTALVSAEDLANQFVCKFKQVSSLGDLIEKINKKTFLEESDKIKSINHIKLKLPFTRIRISGGEPLHFSQDDVMLENSEKLSLNSGVQYWLDFFQTFDKKVENLIGNKVIYLTDKWSKDSLFPSCLTEVDGRLTIRFDTNGILFGNREIANEFIKGIFNLYKEGKLENLFIQFDYSIKGATPNEYLWSQSKHLPVSQEKNNLLFKPEEHPQYFGYKNITNLIESYCKTSPKFKDCIDITVEKGIDNNPKNKLYLNYFGSLDWNNFSKITNIKFSSVLNCFDLNFGWRASAKIDRYSRRGATIKMTANNGKDSVSTDKNEKEEIFEFRRLHKDDPSFKIIVYPTGKSVTLIKDSKTRKMNEVQTALKTN
jgi:organic radical activating enzyme